ncbi:MAG: hypothetical protein IPO08_16415 [Xanthomonadales bacterium]|nr:hypothetical protein [Xanthomonadales bacterium]
MRRTLPPVKSVNVGFSVEPEDETKLQVGFKAGRTIEDLAAMLERSARAIVARLMEKDWIPLEERSVYLEKYPKKTRP